MLTQDVLRDTGGILMTLNITDPTNNASLSVTVPHGVALDAGMPAIVAVLMGVMDRLAFAAHRSEKH